MEKQVFKPLHFRLLLYKEIRNLYHGIKAVSIITFTLLNTRDQQTHRSELLDGSNFLLKKSMLETIFGLKPFYFLVGTYKFDGCCHFGIMPWQRGWVLITANITLILIIIKLPLTKLQ